MMNEDCDTCAATRARGQHGFRPGRWILIGLGVLLGWPCKAAGQSEPSVDSAAARLPQQASERSVDPTVDQINAIRRQMGGGVASQLEGLFDSPDQGRQQLQRQFDRRLHDLVGGPTSAQVSTDQPCLSSGSSLSVCVKLRKAARKLDAVAADLEDIEFYMESDQIRGNARNLRLRARTMASKRTANAVLPGGAAGQRVLRSAGQSPPPQEFGLPTIPTDPKIRSRQ